MADLEHGMLANDGIVAQRCYSAMATACHPGRGARHLQISQPPSRRGSSVRFPRKAGMSAKLIASHGLTITGFRKAVWASPLLCWHTCWFDAALRSLLKWHMIHALNSHAGTDKGSPRRI
jgi:hypothetical protein